MKQPFRILVIEDHPDTREAMTMLLRRDRHDVAAAGSGCEAMQILEEREFDLIISDISMPGIDGVQFMRGLRGARRVRAIALTACSHYDRQVTIEAGFSLHLRKPVSIQTLRGAIEEIMAVPVMEARVHAPPSRCLGSSTLSQ